MGRFDVGDRLFRDLSVGRRAQRELTRRVADVLRELREHHGLEARAWRVWWARDPVFELWARVDGRVRLAALRERDLEQSAEETAVWVATRLRGDRGRGRSPSTVGRR